MSKRNNVQAAPAGAAKPSDTTAVQTLASDAGQNAEVATLAAAAPSDLLLLDADAGEVLTFPALYKVSNNTPSRAAFPVVRAIIESHDFVVVEIRDADQLTSFRTDAKRLCEINGWVDGFTATLHVAEVE